MNEKKPTKLNISDVTSEANISIIGVLDNKKMELPTEYANLTEAEIQELDEKFSDYLALETILKQWQEKLQEVSFKGTVSKIDLIVINSDGVYHWENVKIIRYVLQSGKSIHIATVRNPEGERYNRRRGIRININKKMKVIQDDKVYPVIVKDLSYCGVAIEELNGSEIDKDKAFVLMLTDTDADGVEFLVAKLTGRVNNQKETGNGSVVSGCILAADHASDLQRYIANKQIAEIRGMNVGKKIKKNVVGDNWKKEIAIQLDKKK